MRKPFIFSGIAIGLLAFAYACWPVVEAYRIRQAVRDGNTVVLGAKVDWASVRASLKQSVAELISRDAADPSNGSDRSVWANMKIAMAPVMADRFIDAYVSAEGIGKIDAARHGLKSARGAVARLGEGDLDAAWVAANGGSQPGRIERFMAFYNRIVRAQFHSYDRVEFEIRDRNAPERRYISEFRLLDLNWKLVSVRVAGAIF